MKELIDKATIIAKIEEYKATAKASYYGCGRLSVCEDLIKFLNTLEVKEVDLDLIIGWFEHIAQIADDRMTLTNQRMPDANALDEIKCLAKDSSEFIKKYYIQK